MIIICQVCKGKDGGKKTTASFLDQPVEPNNESHDTFREVVCDECGSVVDSWFFNSKDKEGAK